MNAFISTLDFAAAIAMLAMMKVITANFGWYTPEDRWALVRRIYYTVMAIALFAKGAHRLKILNDPIDYMDVIPQIIIVAGLLFFPMLRALGLLTQDRWRDQWSSRRSPQ